MLLALVERRIVGKEKTQGLKKKSTNYSASL